MTANDFFSSRAAEYTRYRPDYPDALIEFVVSIAPRRGVAWDCATGNGQAAVALARHFDRVIATDASAAQIARARHNERVEYRLARAESSGLADASVDLLTVAQALHWFDLERFYAEADRVLVDGGAIAVWTYGDPVLDDSPLDETLQRFNKVTMGPWWPRERTEVGAAYLAYPFPFDEVLAPGFTIERTWALSELAGYLRSWSAVTRYCAAHDDDPVLAFEVEASPQWGDGRHTVRWPVTVRAGRKRRPPGRSRP